MDRNRLVGDTVRDELDRWIPKPPCGSILNCSNDLPGTMGYLHDLGRSGFILSRNTDVDGHR